MIIKGKDLEDKGVLFFCFVFPITQCSEDRLQLHACAGIYLADTFIKGDLPNMHSESVK